MWLMILNAAKRSPKDLWRLYHVSLFFRGILQPARVEFLFAKVLRILTKAYVGKQTEMQNLDHPRATLTTYVRKIDKELTSGLLKCRLVSKYWNEAVEKCYERPLMTGITPLIDHLNQRRTIVKPVLGNEIAFSFQSFPEKAHKFCKIMEDSHNGIVWKKNPFLGRHVRFDVLVGEMSDDKAFINDVSKMLRLFGKHIWYITFVFLISPGNVAHVVEAYLTLVRWLQALPNLKYLCIQLNAHEARKILPKFIAKNPMPKLEFLKVLEVHLLTGPVLEELITKNYPTPYFRINSNQNFKNPMSNIFSNLKGVGLRYTGEERGNLIHYIGGQCSLELLHLHEEYEDFDVIENFRLLNCNWSATLVDLTLDITRPKDPEKLVRDSKLWQLNLPRLERLSVRIFGIYFLDFILPLKNLKTLELMTVSGTKYDEISDKYKETIILEQKIEYMGFEKRLNESNIWYLLPNLENIKVTFGGHFGDPVTYYEYHKRK